LSYDRQSSRNTCVSGVFSCPKTGFSLIFSLIGSTGGNCTDKTLHAVGTLFVPGQYAAVRRSLASARVSNRPLPNTYNKKSHIRF
jgi:hypothetical protein